MPANPPIEWEDVARLSGTDDDCSFVSMCGTSKRGSGFAYHRVIRGTETMLKGRTGYTAQNWTSSGSKSKIIFLGQRLATI